MTLNCNEIPEWDSFVEFLLKCSQALENVSRCAPAKTKQEFISKQKSFSLQNNKTDCLTCDQEHVIFKCKSYLDLIAQDRLNLVHKLSFFLIVSRYMKLLHVLN